MKGYKATDKDMQCRGYQFKIGEWFETKAPLELCRSGFHFCKYPSGVFSYYDAGCRVFEVEAEGILDAPVTPGADYKLVCSKIKFLREIFPDGNGNTGGYNAGCGNTGGYNVGHRNTGYRNTGDCNTGDCNTGDCNTGDGNTGDGNTGCGNTGFFCQEEAKIFCFDIQTDMSRDEFISRHPEVKYLLDRLFNGEVDWEKVKSLPGITKKKLKSLLDKHRKAREVTNE